MSTGQALAGGWSAWDYSLSTEAKEVFAKACKGLGVDYKPMCCSTQVVNGINYAFLCEAKMTNRMGTKYIAMVNVHAATDGTASITGVKPVGPMPNGLPGGFSSWDFDVNKQPQASFDQAMKEILGATYVAQANTAQVVSGMNYVYLAKTKPTMPEASTYPTLVTIHQPLPEHGPAQLMSIERINP